MTRSTAVLHPHSTRLRVALAVLALSFGLAACGGSSDDNSAKDSGSDVTDVAGDATDTTMKDPFARPEPRKGAFGKEYPFSFERAETKATASVAGIGTSDNDEVAESVTPVDVELKASTDKGVQFSVAVLCDGEPAPMGTAAGSKEWNVVMSGGALELEADGSNDGTVTMSVPKECANPQFELGLLSANGAMATSGDEGPVVWDIPTAALG